MMVGRLLSFQDGHFSRAKLYFRSFWPDTVAFISYALTMNGHIDVYPIGVSCHASPTENMPFHVHPLDAFPLWNAPCLEVVSWNLFACVVFIPESSRRLELLPVPSWKNMKFTSQAKWGSPKMAWGYCKSGSMEVKVGIVIVFRSWHFAVVGLYLSCRGW